MVLVVRQQVDLAQRLALAVLAVQLPLATIDKEAPVAVRPLNLVLTVMQEALLAHLLRQPVVQVAVV